MNAKLIRPRAALTGCVLLACLTGPVGQHAAGGPQAASGPAGGAAAGTIDLLVVPEEDSALVCLTVPLVGRLGSPGRLPVLLVAASAGGPETDLFLRQLKPRRCLVVTSSETGGPLRQGKDLHAEVVRLRGRPTQAGLELARRFWGTTEKVVVAEAADPSAVILASALAAHVRAPLVPLDGTAEAERVRTALDALKAKEVLVVSDRRAGTAAWLNELPQQVRTLDPAQAAGLLVRTVGPRQVRNVIVARAPDAGEAAPDPALLAPYLSLVRKAAVALVRSGDGPRIEGEVLAFIATHGLQPQTITLLGDHQRIGLISLSDRSNLGEYVVEVEPCSAPAPGRAAAFGVGRIPHAGLRDASLLIARGLARERIVAGHRPRVLMIANPQTEYGVLPFAETVSRVTGQEFRNLRLGIDEFYGRPADSPEIVRASAQAHLIVYQGHVTDQVLFQDPTPVLPQGGQEEVPVIPDGAGAAIVDPAGEGLPVPAAPAEGDQQGTVVVAPQPAEVSELPPEPIARPGAGDSDPPPPEPTPAAPVPPAPPPPDLDGVPLVILQSCHSLDAVVGEKVFRRGGAGLVGSVTNVHSASGSAWAKAYCDGMLYRGQTAGEALRDARNYFLCLARLKAQRGHQQQAKVYRVAMSFRLWGDPELRILPATPARARLAPVSGRFTSADKVRITTPGGFLPECRTSRYVARMLPGSQAAGIVRRLTGKEQRRLMPTYFFVLPAPEGFADRSYTALAGEGDAARRGVFLTDPAGRRVYLLYFPEKDRRRAEITLQFVR